MYGLTSTLSTASEALNAASGAIAVTNNNITNVNTAGYARQTVNLSAAALANGGTFSDGGVTFGGFQSVRDQVLALNINQKTSDTASFAAQSTLLSQVEGAFSSTDSGVGAAITTLFSSISALSTAPADPATRQSALSAADGVVTAFHQAAATLSQTRTSADATIVGVVQQINQLSSQIADLNTQLAASASSGQDGGNLEDQRDALTSQLSQLTGLTSSQTDSVPTLGLNGGAALVIGSKSYSLQLAEAPDGSTNILDSQGRDITDSITGGTLGGALSVRDSQIPSLSQGLDGLASEFASAMNAAQATGFDPQGNQGQPMFSIGTGGPGAAASLALALPDASGIATSSDGSANSSGNVTQLLAVSTQALSSGDTPTQRYASFVQQIGTLSAQATSSQTATQASLDQLTNMRSSESGVSIDEETTNLLRYQQAYSAAAQVISTLNSLFATVLGMSGAN